MRVALILAVTVAASAARAQPSDHLTEEEADLLHDGLISNGRIIGGAFGASLGGFGLGEGRANLADVLLARMAVPPKANAVGGLVDRPLIEAAPANGSNGHRAG